MSDERKTCDGWALCPICERIYRTYLGDEMFNSLFPSDAMLRRLDALRNRPRPPVDPDDISIHMGE